MSQFCPTNQQKAGQGLKFKIAKLLICKNSLKRYALCKAADRGMVITDVKLLEKHGGKSGNWVA